MMNKIFKSANGYRFSPILVLIAFAMLIHACKEPEFFDPYSGGKAALGIKFDNALPDPELATQGSQVAVLVRGLEKFKGEFKFYVNETEAQVIAFTDSTATIKVPDNASTGGLTVVAREQTFFGPVLRIDGRVAVDPTFKTNGATFRTGNGALNSASIKDLSVLPNGNSIFVGDFNNFDNKWAEGRPNGGIVQVAANGDYVTPSADLNFGKGVDGAINTIIRLTNGPHSGKYIVAGSFDNYVSPIRRRERLNSISNITRINANGTLDTTVLEMVNPTPNLIYKNNDTVPVFNGGVLGPVTKTFVYNDRAYLIGNFQYYARRYYERSTYDSKVLETTLMRQLVRLKINEANPTDEGDIDLTYHYDSSTKQSPAAGNGRINDAIQLPDGKIILVGSFTTFNGQPSSRIVRLNLDGSVDASFNVGSGADNDIISITYNQTTNKILISGLFKNFGGSVKQGVAMLNLDGSLNTSFNFGTVTDGIPTFAAQLNNGKVIVSGGFGTYNSVVRQGFMILNPDGALAPGFNNTGRFVGKISKIIESTSGATTRVTIVGDISRFDNQPYKGVLRITLRN